MSFKTRGFDEQSCSETVREAIEGALESLDGPPDVDPLVPSWYALSRMQREVVEQQLKRLSAEHKARAAARNLARDQGADVDYEIADAFDAALECLRVEYQEEPGATWVPLTGVGTAMSSEPAADAGAHEESEAAKVARRARLASTVEELREKNRLQAEGARKKGRRAKS